MGKVQNDMYFASSDEPCLYCERTPTGGAWGRPCEPSPDRLHWSLGMIRHEHEREKTALGQDLRRAAYELERAAKAIEALPDRLRCKVTREQPSLDPELLANEAERARDTLHVYRLLDI